MMASRAETPKTTAGSADTSGCDWTKRRRSSVRIVMTPKEEVQSLLANAPYIKDLDEHDRAAIAETCTVRQYDAQAEIIRCGDISSDLLIVMHGKCRVLV